MLAPRCGLDLAGAKALMGKNASSSCWKWILFLHCSSIYLGIQLHLLRFGLSYPNFQWQFGLLFVHERSYFIVQRIAPWHDLFFGNTSIQYQLTYSISFVYVDKIALLREIALFTLRDVLYKISPFDPLTTSLIITEYHSQGSTIAHYYPALNYLTTLFSTRCLLQNFSMVTIKPKANSLRTGFKAATKTN